MDGDGCPIPNWFWIQSFSFSKTNLLIYKTNELSLPYYLPIAGLEEKRWIHTYSKGIIRKLDASSLVQGLNSDYQVYFLLQ